MSLDRFKKAQQDDGSGIATALRELQAGRKTSHWIWYVFPQLASLGRSSTARFYGLTDFAEACAYLQDPILYEHLLAVAETVNEKLRTGAGLTKLMGGETDSLKLMSSMTLFQLAAERLDSDAKTARFARLADVCREILIAGERQGFARCAHTAAACVPG